MKKFAPLIVVVLGLLSTLAAWRMFEKTDDLRVRGSAENHAANVKKILESRLKVHASALERMAWRWSERGGTPRSEWESDVRHYLNDFDALKSVEWIDASGAMQWNLPDAAAGDRMATVSSAVSNSEATLDNARSQNMPIVTPISQLGSGEQGFAVYVPLSKDGEFDGFMAGVFQASKFIALSLPSGTSNDYQIRILDGESELFATGDVAVADTYSAEAKLDWLGSPLRLRVAPSESVIEDSRSHAGRWVLIVGALLSCLLGWTIWLAQNARRRAEHAARTAADLENEVSSREGIQKELEETFSLQRALLNAANHMIISTDAQGTIASFNKAAEKRLGYTADEVIGKQTPKIFHVRAEVIERAAELSAETGEDFEPGFEVFVHPVRKKGIDEREWTFVRKDGSAFPTMLSINALYGGDGEISGFLGVAEDITERKLAADALLDTERRFRDFLNSSLAFFCTHKLDGTVLSVSPAACEALGYRESELVGRDLSTMLPRDAAGLLPIYLKQLELDGESRGLMRVLTKSGDRRIWSYANVVRSGPDGSKYVLGASQDVTELKDKEEELRRSENQFRAFINNSPTVIFLKNEQGNYELINRSFEKMMNVTLDDLAGKTDFDLFPPEIAGPIWANDRKVLNTGSSIVAEEFVPAPDGTPEYWVSHKFPITDEAGGKFVGGVAVNISERKWMEEQLEHARDAALQSARLKSEFLANMSHEIRTPMNGVLGMTELLLAGDLRDDQLEHAQMIKASAESLLGVINDILDFSKIEAGKLEFESVNFDLSRVMSETLAAFSERARVKNIDLSMQVESGMNSNLRGDPNRLRQVLTNLVSNAVKFTQRGRVTINVSTVDENSEWHRLRFAVADTGIGIDPASRQHLFHAFTQADGSITRKYGGTGLGLAISKQLVEMMGGEIDVESGAGEGSTFWFTANFQKQFSGPANADVHNGQPTTADPTVTGAVREVPAERGTATILIAEDNLVNQKIARLQMEMLGHSVDVVPDGLSALDACRSRDYSLILMDCQMPEMDGYTATAEIRSGNAGDPDVPIIAMTANAMSGEREKCLAAGMNDYISKPFKVEQLGEIVHRWLSERASLEKTRHTLPDELNAEQTLDRSVLTEFASLADPDGSDILGDLAKLFIDDSTCRLDLLRDAVKNADGTAVKQQAHALKGGAGNIGAVRLMHLADLLSENADRSDRCRDVFAETEREASKVFSILSDLCRVKS